MSPLPDHAMRTAPGALIERGVIAYRNREQAVIGREWFDLWMVPGGRLLRALCIMAADERGEGDLVRDVSMALDRDWRPRDGWSRVMRPAQGDDALWFRVSGERLLADTRLAGEDRAQAVSSLPFGLPYLGLHPLQGDALIAMARGRDEPGVYRLIASATNSVSPNGDAAPGAHLLDIAVAWVGESEISVPAGRFAADHFRLRWRQDWPAADLWVRRGDCLFLRMAWELVEGDFVLETLETAQRLSDLR
ncbi:hypothetical protein [Novosphingobium sp. 9]|uniref:hypothetical protein n=1 Tax=Novosphingobium sp. 9 TaxID=2025349 RepID=UPI0021B650DE|nr:hypothetical protein [Novosphingobium sp. 9]